LGLIVSLLSSPVTPFTFLAIFSTFAFSLSLVTLPVSTPSVVGVNLNRLSSTRNRPRSSPGLIHNDIVGYRRLVLSQQRRQDEANKIASERSRIGEEGRIRKRNRRPSPILPPHGPPVNGIEKLRIFRQSFCTLTNSSRKTLRPSIFSIPGARAFRFFKRRARRTDDNGFCPSRST